MIRNATPADSPILHDLVEQLGYFMDLSVFQEIVLSYLEDVDRAVLVAEEGGQVVGCLALDILQSFHREKKQMRIISLVVDQKFRSKGIGAQLLRFAEEMAKEQNCWIVELTSSSRRELDGTHEFYLRHGYHKNGDQAYFRKLIPNHHQP